MVTVEEEAPLGCLSGLKLRRDPDTWSGLRSPAATDKGDLEINVSVAAIRPRLSSSCGPTDDV